MVLCLHMHKFLTLWTSTDKLSKQKVPDSNLYEKGGLQGQTDPPDGAPAIAASAVSTIWIVTGASFWANSICSLLSFKRQELWYEWYHGGECTLPLKDKLYLSKGNTKAEVLTCQSNILLVSKLEHSSSICLQTYMKFPCAVHPLSALLYCVYHD